MLKRIIYTFQANFLVAILTLILTIVTTKFLGAYGRGYLSILATYLGIIQLLTGIVGPGTLPFLLRKYNYSSILFLAIFWSIVISLVATFILSWLGFVSEDILIIFFLNAFTGSIFLLNIRMLISADKLKWYNILVILQPIVILTCLFVYGVNKFDSKDFFYFQFISYLIGISVSTILLKDIVLINFNAIKTKELIKEAFTVGTFNQLSSFTQLLNYRFSFFFLEKFSGLNSVGIFSIILSFANVIWLFGTTAGNLIGDEMNKFKNNKRSGIKLIDKYLKFSLVASFVLLLIVYVIPSSIYVFILGDDFEGLNHYLLMFSPAIFVFSISKVLAYYFSSLGKVKICFLASILGLIPTISGYWFSKYLDLNGVLISTTLSFFISTIVLIYYYNQSKKEEK